MKKWLTGLPNQTPQAFLWSFMIALLCLGSAPVLAKSFVVSKKTSTAQSLDAEDETGEITPEGSIEEPGLVGVIIIDKATFVNSGKIITKADNSPAVEANDLGAKKAGAVFRLKRGSKLETSGDGSAGFRSSREDMTFIMEGGVIKTTGTFHNYKDLNNQDAVSFAHGVQSSAANFTFIMQDGTIEATGAGSGCRGPQRPACPDGTIGAKVGSSGFYSTGAKAKFTMKGGRITSKADVAAASLSFGDDFTFLMEGGLIAAEGDMADGFVSIGERLSFTMTGGRITSAKGNAVFLTLKGNADESKDYEHVVKIGRGARLAAPAEGKAALVFEDDGGKSRALVDIAGTLVASEKVGNGINIRNMTGGFHKFEISGTVRAETAIRKADFVNLPLVMTIKQDARIIGDVNMGSLDGPDDGIGAGNDGDTITVRDNARIIGDVKLGAGVDTLNLMDKAQIIGEVDTGVGDDVVTMKDNAEIIGDVKLGAGDDTFKLEGRARVIGLVDGGANTEVSEDNPGDTLDVTGMVADRRTQAATSFSLRYQGFETIKGLPSANRKNYLVGINVKGQDGYDAEKESRLVSIEPTGQAVEARAQGILVDALHDLGDRRGRAVSGRYASRPVQVAARGRMTGLLAPDTRPSMWGEGFGGFQRRGKDGFAKAYAFNHIGVAFGIEQDYRGERTRLGMLFGYVGGSFKTRPSSIKTDNKSFVLGLYGRHRLDEVRENLYLQGGLNFHFSKHVNRRQVLLSKSVAKGKYDSWGMSPSLTLGYVSRLDNRFSLEPSVNLRYSVGFYDAYREKGEAKLEDKLSVNRRTQQSLAGRLNLAGIYHLPDEAGSVALRLGLSHRRLFASDLKGSVSGQAFQFKSAGSDSVSLLHAGLDINVNLTESLLVSGRWEYASSVGGVSDHGNNGLLSLAYEF